MQLMLPLSIVALAAGVSAQSSTPSPTTVQASASVTVTSSSSSFSETPVSTSIPSPTLSLDAPIPSSNISVPPIQEWCNGGSNETAYCPSLLLQLSELSGIYGDSKTFPDKPTVGSANSTFSAFQNLTNTYGTNLTVGEIATFVEQYFKGEGLELTQVEIQNFSTNPDFLENVNDTIYNGFASIVHGYWSLLVRETNDSALCQPGVCDSSLIPLNNTIIVPGGRYREVYYWDSFWILEGLLTSQLTVYATDLLMNFMDLIDLYGFLPNGGRKYYLNRSQPPVFVQMLHSYVISTGNTSILERGLPIAEAELAWWQENRSLNVTSPYTNETYTVAHFNVNNSAPRPEGYVEDFQTAYGASPPLNDSQRADLYAEIASCAETGWDFSSRWCKEPELGILNNTDNDPILRTLNTRAIIPVDLNSLLAGDHRLMLQLYAAYYNLSGVPSSYNTTNSSMVYPGLPANISSSMKSHQLIADEYESAVLDLCWDESKAWFYDFNVTAGARSDLYHAGGTFPLWQNITPEAVRRNESKALEVFSGLRFLSGFYEGLPTVSTLLQTGLNWDFPNSWPPHAYTAIKALESIDRTLANPSTIGSPTIGNLTFTNFSQVAVGQFGLNETGLVAQPTSVIGNNSQAYHDSLNELQQGMSWPQALAVEIANRYAQATFCSWYSSGGSIPNILAQLPNATLALEGSSSNNSGNMFEKFNATDTDASGGGGEYTVVVGFGWTNGVLLWIAENYGEQLVTPSCPLISFEEEAVGRNSTSTALYKGFRLNGNF